MRRPLAVVFLSLALALTVGATRSWAGTITFNDTSLLPEGSVSISIGDTLPLTNNIVDAVEHLLPLGGFQNCKAEGAESIGSGSTATDADPVTLPGADYAYLGGFIVTGAEAPALNAAPAGADPIADVIVAFDDVCEAAQCGGGFANISMPASDLPADSITPLVVATPEIASAPESGSLFLVGLGLIAGAQYLRRRKLA